ncbi:MAG: ABC transporter ATP-binding protein [Thiohalocapsa sp.]
MDELLTVHALERRFGTKQALRGLDFTLGSGEVLGLLGRNGAGKTTCLRILSGNLAPSNGCVRIRGFDLSRSPNAAKRHVGYLPEAPPLYPEMRVDEYLYFCARLHRVPPGSVDRVVRRSKQRCGLEQVGRRLLGKLSKGYRQRAGLAQALIHEPALVILDEPTDGLDPVQIREVRGLIRDLSPSCAVILSSHALSEVQAVCSRVLMLRDGEVLHQAALGEQSAGRLLRVRLRRPPQPTALSALPMVAQATPLGTGHAADHNPMAGASSGRFRIELTADATADELARVLVEAGWGLQELRAEHSDLERLFFKSLDAGTAA